jgi:hypothetical protein
MTITRCPLATNACGNDPHTSAKPPVFDHGATSEVTKTIFFGDSDSTMGSISKPGVKESYEDGEDGEAAAVASVVVVVVVVATASVEAAEAVADDAAAASFAAFSTVYSESPPT